MKFLPNLMSVRILSALPVAAVWLTSLAFFAQINIKAAALPDQVGAIATQITQGTLNEIESLWKRIDDRRLKNRTPDEIVAWVLMGLVVGGLAYRLSNLSQVTTILIGGTRGQSLA